MPRAALKRYLPIRRLFDFLWLTFKKTGLSGIGGNKGGCAIRLEYSNTRICFVTAHLAAGFTNYDERNRDYETISNELRFQKNKTISDHDTIIWLGDFNYRIELSNDEVKKLLRMNNLDALYESDQVWFFYLVM